MNEESSGPVAGKMPRSEPKPVWRRIGFHDRLRSSSEGTSPRNEKLMLWRVERVPEYSMISVKA